MFLIIIFFTILFTYFFGKRNFNYWKKRNVTFEKPQLFFGNLLKRYIENVNESDSYANLYKKYPDEKYVGFFEGNSPALLIRDPDIIKQIMLYDFKHFHRRGIIPSDHYTEPLLKTIVFIDGDTWKLMRSATSPFFSVGKLKAIFPVIEERAKRLLTTTEKLVKFNNEIDVHDLLTKYITDVISTYCFGIDTDSLNNNSSFFCKVGKRIFKPTARDIFVAILKRIAPKLTRKLHFFESELENKILSLIFDIMSKRNQVPNGSNDFLDYILELKQVKRVEGRSIEKFDKNGLPVTTQIQLDDYLLAAQVFGFFGAGFETSSHASSMLLHILAYHPEEQTRCQQDIDDVLERYDGKICYSALKEMKYLEMAFKESMRLQPSPGFIVRKSVNKYTFPNTNLSIDEDVRIIISTAGLHIDEQYFEDAHVFRPERFHPDNIKNINKNVYLPFGTGHRACVGERLAIMQSLAGAATILRSFTVSPSINTVRNPRINPTSTIVQSIENGLPLKLTPRINNKIN